MRRGKGERRGREQEVKERGEGKERERERGNEQKEEEKGEEQNKEEEWKKEEKEADGEYFIWQWLKIFEGSINIRGLLRAVIIRYVTLSKEAGIWDKLLFKLYDEGVNRNQVGYEDEIKKDVRVEMER